MSKVLAAALVVVVSAAVLAIWAPQSAVIDVPPAQKEAGDGSGVTQEAPVSNFYNVDIDNLPPAAPGTMIKTEKIDQPANERRALSFELHRFMYHSTTIQGQDIPVSGLYAEPAGEPPETGWPLIAYAHGTMGAAPKCGVSQAPYHPKTPSGSQFSRKIEPLVKQGWAVVASDYQGMGPDITPAYLIGDAEGRNVLDSVRAVQSWRTDIDRSKTMLWGHSQGGQAVIFASQIQKDYAPELLIPRVVSLAPAIIPANPAAMQYLG
ncbi:MAG: lipase family protein, partial [Mycobacterium sp.]